MSDPTEAGVAGEAGSASGSGTGRRISRSAPAPQYRRGTARSINSATGGASGGATRGPRDLTRQTLLVCALIGTTQMTWGTIVPALPLYVTQFGATALILGPIIAAFGLGRAIANIPAGIALRWWRPRKFLIVVSVLLILVTAVTGFSPNAGTLIVARVIAGLLGGAAITIGFAVLVAGAPPERRGWVMSTATAVQMSAGALGAFLGGLVLSWFPLPIAFVVAPLPLLFVLILDLWRPASHYWDVSLAKTVPAPAPALAPASASASAPTSAPASASASAPTSAPAPAPAPESASASASAAVPAAAPTAAPAPSPDQRAPRARRSPVLPVVVIALALASFGTFVARFGGEQGLIPLLAYGRGGLTPFTLGLALAAATVVSLVAMPIVGAILDRGVRLAVFVPSALAAVGAMLLFPVATGPWQYAAIIVIYGLANCVAGVVPSVVTSESVSPAQSGFVVGLTRTAGDAGAVAGPLVVFAAYAAGGGPAGAGVIAAVLIIANTPLVVWLARRRRGELSTVSHDGRSATSLPH